MKGCSMAYAVEKRRHKKILSHTERWTNDKNIIGNWIKIIDKVDYFTQKYWLASEPKPSEREGQRNVVREHIRFNVNSRIFHFGNLRSWSSHSKSSDRMNERKRELKAHASTITSPSRNHFNLIFRRNKILRAKTFLRHIVLFAQSLRTTPAARVLLPKRNDAMESYTFCAAATSLRLPLWYSLSKCCFVIIELIIMGWNSFQDCSIQRRTKMHLKYYGF